MKRCRKSFPVFFLILIICLAFISSPVQSQPGVIKGRVVYEKDNRPAAFATIELARQQQRSSSDRSGNFTLAVPALRKDDTLLISMVGFETLRLPLPAAMNRTEFVLKEKTKTLQNVTVKAFSTQDVQGSSLESVGYIRSWNSGNTGGEIGRIFNLPYEEYKIDKIRFKVNNLCDTCLIRLHIRSVENGLPGEEIFEDSIATTIHKLTLDDKAPEFDLRNRDLTFTESEIFVSFEVLNCRSKTGSSCYFSFAGTERGEYIFKSKASSEWQSMNDYTIYMKLFLRY